MNQPLAIDILVEALAAVPEYDNPLNPIYEALGRHRPALSSSKGPLTLRAIHQHAQLLHDHAEQARDQTYAVNQVIQSCVQISPTPLPLLPLGF